MLSTFYPALRDAAVSGLVTFMQQRDTRENIRGLGFIAFAAPLLLVALIFMALGFFFWIEPLYGPGAAFALTGAVLLALGLWFLYVGRRMMAVQQQNPPLYTEDELALLIDGVACDLEENIDKSVQNNPKTAVATAALAGFLAGKGLICR